MLEKYQGRWSLLDGYELLASSEARGALRRPIAGLLRALVRGNFFRPVLMVKR
jgi:hypothetical protein